MFLTAILVGLPYIMGVTIRNHALNRPVSSNTGASTSLGGQASNVVDGIVSACSTSDPNDDCWENEKNY